MYLKDKKREWTVVVVYEVKERIKKIKKINILIKCSVK